MRSMYGVDLGLAVSGALLQPGQTRSHREIAAFCGCTTQNIQSLEQRAMQKLRHAVLFKPELKKLLADELHRTP